METIFDHNPTPEELKAQFGRATSKEEHLANPFSQGTEYAIIYCLYKRRGDAGMTAKYRALVSPDFLQTCIDLEDIVLA